MRQTLAVLLGASVWLLPGCTATPGDDAPSKTQRDEPAREEDADQTASRDLEEDGESEPGEQAASERSDAAPRAPRALDAGPARAPSPRSDAGMSQVSGVDAASRADAASTVSESGAGAATGPGSAAQACQGKPGRKRGKSQETMMAGGARRSFVYYAPKGLDPNTPVPLVLIPHGTNMSGQGMFDITRYAELAEREKFVAIFPDGIDGPGSFAPWDVGSGVCGIGAVVAGRGNDQAFVDELINFAAQDQCLDQQHIFMTGFSMGGYFSNETGCVSSKIRAIAPHSGGTHDLSKCPAKYKPAIIFHFKSDSLISYQCGAGARDQWVKRNGCDASSPEVVKVKGGACEYYRGCPADGQVAFCSFEGPSLLDDGLPSGHGWSGGAKAGGESFAAITGSESATELGWAFFKKYAW